MVTNHKDQATMWHDDGIVYRTASIFESHLYSIISDHVISCLSVKQSKPVYLVRWSDFDVSRQLHVVQRW